MGKTVGKKSGTTVPLNRIKLVLAAEKKWFVHISGFTTAKRQ
jgi:hypothetical protein